MSKRTVFISCGQYTQAEKSLGRQIAEMVKKVTGLEPFFAEDVQDLNGLDANILGALRDCVGFIVVLHPRGQITRPDKPAVIRGSVWIEQEIAIATYIQRVEKRALPTIAFKHKSVSREGIRELLHLNPIEFTDESKVLAVLPEALRAWKLPASAGIQLKLKSVSVASPQDHPIRRLEVVLVNDTNQEITAYNCKLNLPAGILKHWSASYGSLEVPANEAGRRCFRFSQKEYGSVNPRDTRHLFATEYCTRCAMPGGGGIVEATIGAEASIDATIWIDGCDYSDRATIKELAVDADRNMP